METRSRVQRYAQLREKMLDTQIDSENVLEVSEQHLTEKPVYQPTREKMPVKPEFKIDDFNNEYLDEFIKEVKEYNIRKGNAVSEDTQINVLQELISNDAARDTYIEEIEEVSYFDDISKQVAALLEEDQKIENIVSEVLNEKVSEEVIDEAPKQEDLEESPVLVKTDMNYQVQNQDLLEQTRQISIKIDQYQEDMKDYNSKVNKTNKILNIIIVVLIVLILIVIGLAIWYALTVGNHAF